MKRIVDGKLYDTEKAEKLYTYDEGRQEEVALLFDATYHRLVRHVIDVYRTKNGAYFEHDNDSRTIDPITAERAADTIRDIDPDTYMSVFGVSVEDA